LESSRIVTVKKLDFRRFTKEEENTPIQKASRKMRALHMRHNSCCITQKTPAKQHWCAMGVTAKAHQD